MGKYDAIYCRQSADRIDSISIESQIEYCQYEVRGGPYKVFQDRGYSGKDTDRPQFQAMLDAIRNNEVSKVVVYRLDRISRSVMDFMNMMNNFQKYGVEFVSCTEKFDTSTPMGRAMLKIIVVFAELERETIQQRVHDAYVSRSRKGFYMGGPIPYGYKLEPYFIDGKKTARYAIEPQESKIIQLIYSLYAQPQVSLGDIARYLIDNGIKYIRKETKDWNRSYIGQIIKNPIYVKADLDIYRFYKEQGAIIHNAPEDFVGFFACYLYRDKGQERKNISLEGQHLVLAPHEGIVSSDIWLKARRKCLRNSPVARPSKAKNTWLAGKLKCGKCGHSLLARRFKNSPKRYMYCKRRADSKTCEGIGCVFADEVENLILFEIQEHIRHFVTLSVSYPAQDNPRVYELETKIEQIQLEVEKWLSKIPDASEVVMGHINKRVQELDADKSCCQQELNALLSSEQQASKNIKQIQDYMKHWDELAFDDKRTVVDLLISVIRVTGDSCEITWKF